MTGGYLPPWVPLAFAGVVGGCLGSFLNVVIGRVPAGESIVSPGSRCPRCKAPIAGYDNLPILSWLFLRARCRRCRAPISARYPLVEVAGAAVALFAEGPTAQWALPLPETISGAPAGLQRFAFELEGLPPNTKPDGATLRLTAVAGNQAIEVAFRLD